MISFIKGMLEYRGSDYIIVEVNNIGYKIMVPKNFNQSTTKDNQVKVYTCLIVKENDMTLYGFKNTSERELFERLLTISGLGVKTALSVLSTFSPENFYTYILNEDIKAISSIPGIGPKTARRVIFELKDKLNGIAKMENTSSMSGPKEEAILALQSLGWSASEAVKIIDKIDISNDATVEDVIKHALKQSNKN
jgi:Holliday junction DNA helicase RuvA